MSSLESVLARSTARIDLRTHTLLQHGLIAATLDEFYYSIESALDDVEVRNQERYRSRRIVGYRNVVIDRPRNAALCFSHPNRNCGEEQLSAEVI